MILKETSPAGEGQQGSVETTDSLNSITSSNSESSNTTTVARDSLLDAEISLFQLVNRPTPANTVTVRRMLADIKNGRWRNEIERLREIYQQNGKDAYKSERATLLEAVTFSGTFSKRSNDRIQCHSGILALDFDNLGERITVAREQCKRISSVLAIFASPSGEGLKVLVAVSATDQSSHRAAFEAAAAMFRAKGLEPDEACKDVSRLCFVSFDPEAWQPSSPLLSLFSPTGTGTTAAPIPTSYTLQPAPYALHSTIQAGEEGVHSGRIKRFKKLKDDNPQLADLYEKQVVPHLCAEPGKRNEALMKLVPHLHRAVSGTIAEQLVSAALEVNRDVYSGSMEEHKRSLKSLWDGCEEAYRGKLTVAEREAYDALDRDEQAAFRIFRDLALSLIHI